MANIFKKASDRIDDTKEKLDELNQRLKSMKAQAKRVMGASQYLKCSILIHSAATSNTVVGAIPSPFSHSFQITAAQVGMVVGLGVIFKQEITKAIAEGIFKSAAAHLSNRMITVIPGIGGLMSGVMAGVTTEMIGWMIAIQFAKGKNHPTNFDVNPCDTSDRVENEVNGKACPSLEERAQLFINNVKDVNTSRAEYNRLVEEFEEILDDLAVNDPLRDLYDKLTALDL